MGKLGAWRLICIPAEVVGSEDREDDNESQWSTHFWKFGIFSCSGISDSSNIQERCLLETRTEELDPTLNLTCRRLSKYGFGYKSSFGEVEKCANSFCLFGENGKIKTARTQRIIWEISAVHIQSGRRRNGPQRGSNHTLQRQNVFCAEWSSAARCSRMSPHQHRSITSTSCWRRKMQRSSRRSGSFGRFPSRARVSHPKHACLHHVATVRPCLGDAKRTSTCIYTVTVPDSRVSITLLWLIQ